MVTLRGHETMIHNRTTAGKGGGEGGKVADMGGVWHACADYATAEALRSIGQAQRTVRLHLLWPYMMVAPLTVCHLPLT